MNVLLTLAENAWKREIKLFPLCAILHENFLWVIEGEEEGKHEAKKYKTSGTRLSE